MFFGIEYIYLNIVLIAQPPVLLISDKTPIKYLLIIAGFDADHKPVCQMLYFQYVHLPIHDSYNM